MNSKSLLFILVLFTFFACGSDKKKTSDATETTIGLKDGRWMDTEDTNSGIEIKNGSFFMFTKIDDTTVSTRYEYELDEKDGIEYVTLKNENGKVIIYGLLEYSENSMVLSYLNSGSTLTYTKEK